MDQSSIVISKETQCRQVGDISLNIITTPTTITLTYTNPKFQTFEKIITEDNYQKTVQSFIFIFQEIGDFADFLKNESTKMTFKNQCELIVYFKNPLKEKAPIKQILLLLQKREQSQIDLLLKQIKQLKRLNEQKQQKLDAFDSIKMNIIEQNKANLKKQQDNYKIAQQKLNEQLKLIIKKIEQELEETKTQCKQKLDRIFTEGKKHKPLKKIKILQQGQNFDIISVFALPAVFRKKLNEFKRIYLHQPKYILSVFGKANAGKSTFLTYLMKNPDQSVHASLKGVFPQSDNPLTFYDTFYCYNQTSDTMEIATDIKPSLLLFNEIFEEDATQMTLLCEDNLKYTKPPSINLTKIQQNARTRLIQIQTSSEKMKIFENRYLILRYNIDLLYDSKNKYDFLNRYVVFLDRAGIDDNIYQLNGKQQQQIQKDQLLKIKNETVFYCVPSQDLMTVKDPANDQMLNLMNTHDFQKILLCVNCIQRFTLNKEDDKEKQLQKVVSFFMEMFETIPEHVRSLLQTKISLMEERSKSIQQKISAKVQYSNVEEEKRLYIEDRKLRLQINRFSDELIKYHKICEKFTKFAKQEIKPKEENGISQQFEDKLIEMVKIYPFQNVCYFGLQNYASLYRSIDFLRRFSQEQFKKKVASQSLYSIQKFYYNKLQSLNQYHASLQEYYTHQPIVIRQLKNLNKNQESKRIQTLKCELINICNSFMSSFKIIIDKLKERKSYVQVNRNKHLKILFNTEQRTWQEHLQNVFTQTICQCNENVISSINKYKQSLTNYKNELMKRIKQANKSRFEILEGSIKHIINLSFQELQNLCEISLEPMIIIWNKMMASVNEHLNVFLKYQICRTLKIPKYMAKFGKYYEYKFKEENQNKKEWTFFSNLKKIILESNYDQNCEEYIKGAINHIETFVADTVPIGIQLKAKINEVEGQIKLKQSMLLYLLQDKLEEETKRDKKLIQDVILQMKGQYLEKLRRINYDMVLNGINKFDEYEEQLKKGWIA